MFARNAAKVKTFVGKYEFVHTDAPETAPDNIFQQAFKLQRVDDAVYLFHFLTSGREVDVTVGYGLYTLGYGIAHRTVEQDVLVQIIKQGPLSDIGGAERIAPIAYITDAAHDGAHHDGSGHRGNRFPCRCGRQVLSCSFLFHKCSCL